MGNTQAYGLLCWKNPGNSTSQNSSCTATYLPSQNPTEQDMSDAAGEARTNLLVLFFDGPLHNDIQVLIDQLCAYIWCCVEYQLEAMDDRDG